MKFPTPGDKLIIKHFQREKFPDIKKIRIKNSFGLFNRTTRSLKAIEEHFQNSCQKLFLISILYKARLSIKPEVEQKCFQNVGILRKGKNKDRVQDGRVGRP